MSKPAVTRLTDALKRCARGDTFAKCETECFYGRQYELDCQKHLLKDAMKLITEQQEEIADLHEQIKGYEEDDD